MAKHVWFFPFKNENCDVVNTKTLKRSMGLDGVGQDKKMDRVLTLDVVYDANGPVAAESFDQVLNRIENDTVLYVVGHCAEGSTTLTSVDETKSVTAAALAALLGHLPSNWPGRIKCYGCESALDGVWLCCFATQSFAKRLLDAIQPTHPHLSVWGYSTSVPMSYNQPNMNPALFGSADKVHKHVGQDDRASNYLVRVQ